MKYPSFIFIFCAITFFGCQTIGRIGYGAHKNGKIENEVSILNWLHENAQINTQSVYTIAPDKFYYAVMKYEIGPLIFDLFGNYKAVGRANGAFCPLNFDYYLATVKPLEESTQKWDNYLVYQTWEYASKRDTINDTVYLKIGDINKVCKGLNGEDARITNFDKYDYTLVLPCAINKGNKVQTEDLKKFYDAALRNTYSRFQVVFLNFDKQEWWGEEWNKKIHIEN